jgi:hypothetical protein
MKTNREWSRYMEVEPTEKELEQIENFGCVKRNGKEIWPIVQTDNKTVYGIVNRSGDLLVTGASFLYQSKTDFHDLLNGIIKKYDGKFINDSYANNKVVELPSKYLGNKNNRRNMIAAIEKMTAKCIAEYNAKSGSRG